MISGFGAIFPRDRAGACFLAKRRRLVSGA
jgi:hypothetical protein